MHLSIYVTACAIHVHMIALLALHLKFLFWHICKFWSLVSWTSLYLYMMTKMHLSVNLKVNKNLMASQGFPKTRQSEKQSCCGWRCKNCDGNLIFAIFYSFTPKQKPRLSNF